MPVIGTRKLRKMFQKLESQKNSNHFSLQKINDGFLYTNKTENASKTGVSVAARPLKNAIFLKTLRNNFLGERN